MSRRPDLLKMESAWLLISLEGRHNMTQMATEAKHKKKKKIISENNDRQRKRHCHVENAMFCHDCEKGHR